MASYIKAINIQYDDPTGSLGNEDINKRFRGKYIYLVPEYTWDRSEAANAFSLLMTPNEDLCAADISKGDGRHWFRYICCLYSGNSDQPKITKGRRGDFIFLCWDYEKSGGEDDTEQDEADFVECTLPDTPSSSEDEDGLSIQNPITNSEDDKPPQQLTIESILFSQSNTEVPFSQTPEHCQGGEFAYRKDIQDAIEKLRGATIESREALAKLSSMNVAPIFHRGKRSYVTCDNDKLHFLRSILPPGTEVPITVASGAEKCKWVLKWYENDGLYVKIRAGVVGRPATD